MGSVYRTRGEAWIYAALANDTVELDPSEETIPLADQGIDGDLVFDALAPTGTPGTYIVYNYQGGFDINGTGMTRMMGSLLFTVKVSGENVTKAALEPIADRIDKLLQSAGDTVDGYRVEGKREQELALPPVANGDIITREIGGLYRLYVHKA